MFVVRVLRKECNIDLPIVNEFDRVNTHKHADYV